MKLFSQTVAKQLTAPRYGFRAIMLNLEPNYKDAASGVTTCPDSGLCAAVCLSKCGRNKYDYAQRRRIERTQLFFENPRQFRDKLADEIGQWRKGAQKLGRKLAVRLNGLSDIPWEKAFPELFPLFYDVEFYDYTKSEARALACYGGRLAFIRNYHLTYSLNEKSAMDNVVQMLETGTNVSAIFNGPKPAATRIGKRVYTVIDGDEHDLRFLDLEGVVVGLKFKQPYLDHSGKKIAETTIEKCRPFLEAISHHK